MPSTASDLLTPDEVARIFKVSARTVGRWAKTGKLPAFRTPGGQARFSRSVVEAFLAEAEQLEAEKATA